MTQYHPDKWIVIKITTPEETIEKVLAGWYGGYLGSNSWKLNSGNTEVIEEADRFIFKGYSGSEYHCPKHAYGCSGLMSGVLASFEEGIKVKGEGYSIEVVEKYDVT